MARRPLFTENDFEVLTQEEMMRKLSPKAKEMLDEEIDLLITSKLTAVAECESPIEELMALALDEYLHRCMNIADDGCFVINQQYDVKCSSKNTE